MKTTDEDRILALTNGLDKSYEAFVISLDATPTNQFTLEYVENHLLNEEVRHSNKEERTHSDPESAYVMRIPRLGSD